MEPGHLAGQVLNSHSLLLQLEELVLDTSKPLFQRGFAWFRLLRHWASLRWDDSQGLNPGSFKKLARGLPAQLAHLHL